MKTHEQYLQQCLELAARQALTPGGGPFAALVVKNGEVIAEGCNQVTGSCDPSAHAEVVAIRAACQKLKDYQLTDCIIYSSCEPCPMCLGAIYWARPAAVYFAASRDEAADAGFDDSLIYQQINLSGDQRLIPFRHLAVPGTSGPFLVWKTNLARKDY
jgi:guanine deaminase